MRRERPDARLLLVGAVSPGFDLDRRLQRLGLSDEGIVREAYVEEDRLWSLMAACDVCVNLRSPTMGETSGSVIRQLSLGKPVVVSDVGWFAELPDDVALKVPVGAGETETLYAALELLARDDGARAAMSAAGLELVRREHDLDRAADLYAAALEQAAGGDAVANRGPRRRRGRRRRGRDRGGLARGGRAGAAPRRGRAWSIGCAASRRGRGSPSSSSARSSSAPGSAAGCRRRSSSPTSCIYQENARSLAAGAGIQVRDEPFGIVSVLYPLLLAPAYLLFDSLPDAYAAARTINAVVMSLAAIPAYLIARRAAADRLSLLAALLAVALPSLAYTGTLMSENAFYPAFLLAAWALAAGARRADAAAPARPARGVRCRHARARAGHRRRPGRADRPAAARGSSPAGRCGRGCRFYGIVAGGAVLVVGAQLARGAPISSLFGAYQVVGEESYDVVDVLKYVFWHLAELDLYVGVIPFAAFLLLAARIRSLEPGVQAFVAATIALTVWTLLIVAAFASRFAGAIVERNMFVLAPLLLIGLLVWIDRGAPRPRVYAVVAACVAAVLPGADPVRALPAAEGALRHADDRAALERPGSMSGCRGSTTSCWSAASPPPPSSCSSRAAMCSSLPAVVLAYFAIVIQPIQAGPHGMEQAAAGALFEGIRTGQRDWIDRAVGGRQRRRALDGEDESLHGAHERVLQPLRRPGLHARRADAGWPARDRRPGRPRDRRDPARRRWERGRGGLRAHRRHGRTRRRRGRRRRAARGHRVRGRRPARLDDDRDRASTTTSGPAPTPPTGVSAAAAARSRSRSAATPARSRRSRPSSPPTRTATRSRRSPSCRRRRSSCGCRSGRRTTSARSTSGSRRRWSRAAATCGSSARASSRSTTSGREDRLRRQPALASADRRRQLRPRLARRARRGRGRRARDRRVRADEPGRAQGDPACARRARRRASRSCRCRSRSAGATPGAGSAGRRSSASSATVDVFHYSDWMYPPQAGGVRATTVHDLVPLRFPQWVTPKTRAMHAAKYADTARTADLVFVNSEYTGRDVVERLGVGPERVKVAYPGVKEVFRHDGERADLGRPYVLTVATLEPRKNLQTLVGRASSARRRHPARGRGRQRLGRPAGAAGSQRRPARLRLRRRAGAALPRRRRRRLPVPLRGLRDADHRGDGVRRADGRVGARVDGRGVRRCCRTGRSGRSRGDRRRRSARRSRAGTSSSRPVSSTRGSSPGVRRASRSSPGTRERRRDPGRGRRLPARADAGRDGASRARAARRARRTRGSRGGAALVRRSGQGGVGGARHVVVLRRAAALRTWARPAPLHDLPRPTAGVRAVHGHAPRPRARPASGAVPALAPPLRPRRDRPGRAGGGPGLRRLRVHEARGDRAARRPRRACGRDRERHRAGLHARRAGRRGRVRARGRDAGAAQEPPPDRRRRGAGRRRAARRRRARLGWGRNAGLGRRGRRRGARRALPRRPCARLPLAVRGVRHPCPRGDGDRHTGRDEPGRRDRGGGRRCGGARRSARRRGDRRRNRGGHCAARRAASARARAGTRLHLGVRSQIASKPSGGSSRDSARRRRRRRPRPRAHGRRDVRAQPPARAGAAGAGCRNSDRRRRARPRASSPRESRPCGSGRRSRSCGWR